MNYEPKWRTVLNWSAVIMFFSMPLVLFVMHLISIERGWQVEERWAEFKGLGFVYQTITALVFGLAGLNSWDRRPVQSQTRPVQPQTPRSFPPPQISPPIPKQPSKRSD
jgi:hypothetical protein